MSKGLLLRRCREKIEKGERAFWHAVPRKIAAIRRALGRLPADEDARTVTLGDLESAIMTGRIPDDGFARDAEGVWDVTIRGADHAGRELAVMVRLSEEPDEPLLIVDFSIPQP